MTTQPTFDLAKYIKRQQEWSDLTFGPKYTGTERVLNHIRSELNEIEANPSDVLEWCDIIILALDGAWRNGHEPAEIVAALVKKQTINIHHRSWGEWREAPVGEPIEHIKSGREESKYCADDGEHCTDDAPCDFHRPGGILDSAAERQPTPEPNDA